MSEPQSVEDPRKDAAPQDATEKPLKNEERPQEKAEDAESWLKDGARARDAAGLGHLLETAITELLGSREWKAVGARSGVLIAGDVHVSGDMLGGDKHAAARTPVPTGEIITGEVAAKTLERIARTYVPPPAYEALRSALADHRIVLLQAPGGWGRTTTGLHLLTRLCGGAVQKLNPDTDPRRLNPAKDLKEGCGHLLEIRAVDQMVGLKVAHLEELASSCATADVRLVLTLDEDIRVDDEARAHFGVSSGPRPDLHVVLRRHLETWFEDFGAEDSVAAAARVLDDDEVRAILERFVDDTLGMRRIAELAGRLALHAQDGVAFDAIGNYFEELSGTDFARWFDEVERTAKLAFVVALAVLNGMSYTTVAGAARSLEDKIRAAEGSPDGPDAPGRSMFGVRKTQRLVDARATTTPATGNTQYGPIRVEGVRFRNDSYPGRVLEWLWCEYDDVRPVLLGWLRGLGGGRGREARIRVAATVGLLATLDFERIHREVLLPWADDDDPRVRECAVSALRFPVTQSPELAVHVIRMMRDWSGPHSPGNRRWTAVRAMGAGIGRTIRPEALRLLRRVAAADEPRLSFAVADSVLDLFLGAEENAQTDVIAALVRWTAERAPKSRRDTGTLCFLRLALHVIAAPEDDTVWPGLLWLAAGQEEASRRIGVLWRRALATPGHFVTAQTAFADWVTLAGDEPPIVATLAGLLRRVVLDRYDASRLAEAVRHSMSERGETAATRTLVSTITELEKAL